MTPVPLTPVQEKIEQAGERELISMLAKVLAWETANWNDVSQHSRKIEAQDRLNEILFAEEGNRENAHQHARRFLFKLADQAAARGGF